MPDSRDTTPLKTVPLMDFAHWMFTALTLNERVIAVGLVTNLIWVTDRLAGAAL